MNINNFIPGDKVQIVRKGKTDRVFGLTRSMKARIGDLKVYTVYKSDHERIVLNEEQRYSWHYTSFDLYNDQDEDNQI
jgi:hypothetical protein